MKRAFCLPWFNRNRTNFPQCLAALLLVVLFAGCAREEKRPENIVIIRGSNTIGEELAPRLIAEYAKEHPGTAFDIEFKGTTYGLGALMARNSDIAAASREVTTNEVVLARDHGVEFNDYVIGAYSVAVIVHSGNPVSDLSTNQVRDIFTGTIKNWKELGGTDAPIHLYIRSPVSGTYLGFQEVAMEKQPYSLEVKAFTNHLEIVQAIGRDAQGIGYSSMELAAHPGVKAVSIGGVAPTIESVNEGRYPYSRVLRFYTDKAKESPVARGFVRFVQSARGQKVLEEMGFVPRPSAETQ